MPGSEAGSVSNSQFKQLQSALSSMAGKVDKLASGKGKGKGKGKGQDNKSDNKTGQGRGSRQVKRDSDGNIVPGCRSFLVDTKRRAGFFTIGTKDRNPEIEEKTVRKWLVDKYQWTPANAQKACLPVLCNVDDGSEVSTCTKAGQDGHGQVGDTWHCLCPGLPALCRKEFSIRP